MSGNFAGKGVVGVELPLDTGGGGSNFIDAVVDRCAAPVAVTHKRAEITVAENRLAGIEKLDGNAIIRVVLLFQRALFVFLFAHEKSHSQAYENGLIADA